MRKGLWLGIGAPTAIAALALFGFSALDCASAFRAPKSPPNVLLIFVDTLRVDHLGVYGYERDTSPALDRLASESLVFRSAIAQAPWTTPSIASALTSRYPDEMGYENSRPPAVLADRFLLLPEIFSANNYRTAAIVSHLFVSRKLGFSQGFDEFDQRNSQGHNHVSSPSILKKATQFLDDHGKKHRPFFLFLHFFDPHYAYRLHEPYDFDPDYQGKLDPVLEQNELQEKIHRLSNADHQHIRALYDSEIRFTDEHLGRLFDELRARDLYDDTLIVVAGDHGEEFGSRDKPHIGHSKTLFQELIHVPLIIKLPGKNDHQVIETPVGLVDLAPSLVAAASLEVPEGHRFDGRILPLHKPRELSRLPEVPVFSETRIWGFFIQSVTLGGWKLIVDHRAGDTALYHLPTDPGEQNDLADKQPELVSTYTRLLSRWTSDVRAKREEIAPPAAEFSPEEMERLRALGYLN